MPPKSLEDLLLGAENRAAAVRAVRKAVERSPGYGPPQQKQTNSINSINSINKQTNKLSAMPFSYEITPRPAELGGGWRLQLLEDGVEVGGGVFPVPAEDPHVGMAWWNSMSESDRAYWLEAAKSARPADARQAWRDADAYDDAEREASSWLDSRG